MPDHPGQQADQGAPRAINRRALLRSGAVAAAVGVAAPLMPSSASAVGLPFELGSNPNFYPQSGRQPEVDLAGKLVVITGASRGIGLATGLALQSLGANVIGTSRVPGQHPSHPFPLLELDLEDPGSIAGFVATVQGHPLVLGNGGIDVLFNNAGRFVFGNPFALVPGVYFPAIERSMAVLYGGHVAVSNALFPALAARAAGGYARMLFTTSVAAYGVGGTEPGLSFYHAYFSGKRALLAYANCLRAVAAAGQTGVSISTVNPLAVNTALAEGLNPIYTQPVDGQGNAVGDAYFQLFLEQIRLGLANGLPVELAAAGIVQSLQSAEPDPNIAIGSLVEPYATQGQNEFVTQIGLAENAEAAYGYRVVGPGTSTGT